MKPMKQSKYRKMIWSIVAGITFLAVIYIASYRIYVQQPCTLVAFKLQKGHSTLIHKASSVVIIDGGGSAEILRQVGGELNIFDRAIDLAILSSVDANKISGLIELANRYKIHMLSLPMSAKATSTKELRLLEQIAADKNISLLYVQAPAVFNLGIDISLIAPTSEYVPSKKENPTTVVSASCDSSQVLIFGSAPKRMQKFVAEISGDTHYDALLYQVTDSEANFFAPALDVFSPHKFIYSKRPSSAASKNIKSKSEPSLAQLLGPANVFNIAQGTVRLELGGKPPD